MSDEPRTTFRPEEARFLIVGLGASAGGLEALEEFFDNVAAESGLAYVVVTHQAPGRVSLLPELIARHSKIPVVRVDGATLVEPNHVYVPSPGVTLGMLKGVLQAFDPAPDGPKPLPIDFFFRSLAQDQRESAVGIVLSGTGSDGTLGLKEVKAESGLTIAQEEASARYAGMPHSAIAAVPVDFVLPAREMPAQLHRYARSPVRPGLEIKAAAEGDADTEDVLKRIFVLLRSRTGHDFSQYKPTTVGRRIARRMDVHQIGGAKDYLRFLQTNPQELDRLFKELLIGVTSLFRDTDAFVALANGGMPALLADKPDDYVVRGWIVGCSTGEEAYSVAISLREYMERVERRYAVQLFASDIDPQAIEYARGGLFPESIASDVAPKRLDRYFMRENGCFRVKKEIREMIVFAVQDLIEDPPFTKVDLLCCRNLLIYLNAQIQRRLVPMFHYSLRPGGVLFLGSSETVGNSAELFDPIDKKSKIFRRREVPPGSYLAEVHGSGATVANAVRETANSTPGLRKPEMGLTQVAERALLQHLVPPSVLIHEGGEIVHIQGRTGLFLEPAPGAPHHQNIFNMLREGLQFELTLALRQAAGDDGESVRRGVRVKSDGDSIVVDLKVKRLVKPEPLRGLFLVAFERVEKVEATTAPDGPPTPAAFPERITALEDELREAKEVHQSTVEELETANEELKSANEELQSMNEELQSANEELETSKEEMQSLNEELQTVNSELQGKVEELSRANDDMNNLLNSTDIATIFLDSQLNIKRYTEQAKRIIRLIPSDVGRPIGDLVANLRYSALTDDAREVLRTLVFKETEVLGDDGSAYLMRVLPYRTTDNVIDGLVVTFVNVSRVRHLEEQTQRLLATLAKSPTSVFLQNRDLRYEWAFGMVFGRTPGDLAGKGDEDLLSEADAKQLIDLKRKVLDGNVKAPARERLELSFGRLQKAYDVYIEAVQDVGGQVTGVTGVLTELGANYGSARGGE